MPIHRSKSEIECLRVGATGAEPSHKQKLATIIDVRELKGYMLHLHHESRLDDAARADIAHRLAELEFFYGRKFS